MLSVGAAAATFKTSTAFAADAAAAGEAMSSDDEQRHSYPVTLCKHADFLSSLNSSAFSLWI